MIKIVFDEPVEHELWTQWRKDCDDATPSVDRAITDKKRPVITNLYKRKSIKQTFYFPPEGLFHGKCAYCETYVAQFQNGDIEHYRPKYGVTDEADAPIQADYGWGTIKHWGYFWLAYKWQNLLLVCSDCNRASKVKTEKVGKHNRFPVVGSHARLPGEVAAEQPLLLNPLVDDPQDHLVINTTDGVMNARDGSIRGEKTILILGLNIRDRLIERRLKAIDEARIKLNDIIGNPGKSADAIARREAAMARLREIREDRAEYSAAVRAYLDEMKPYIQLHL